MSPVASTLVDSPRKQPAASPLSLARLVSQLIGINVGDSVTASGIIAAALGALLFTVARVIFSYLSEYIKKMIIATVQFDSREESYAWILNYLSCHPLSRTALQFAVVSEVSRPLESRRSGPMPVALMTDNWTLGNELQWLPKAFFLPADGTHFFWFGYNLLQVSIASTGSSGGGYPMYTNKSISVSALLSRKVLENLIKEAQRLWVEVEKGRTSVYVADGGMQWRGVRSRPIRGLHTVVLDEGVKHKIVSDVTEFLRSEKWYAERGIPYRSLFYGSPGSGKTSFINALAGHFRLNIYVISLSNPNLSDDGLVRLLSLTPTRCVLLLEDVDVAFSSRDEQGDADAQDAAAATGGAPLPGPAGGGGGRGGRGGRTAPGMGRGQNVMGPMGLLGVGRQSLTLSGLLNALDGVAGQEGRVVCLTTNHIEQLDPALIRPGRVDVRLFFDRASRWQAKELFLNFYANAGTDDTDEGADAPESSTTPTPASTLTSVAQPTAAAAAAAPPAVARTPSGIAKVEALRAASAATLNELADAFAASIPERKFSMAELQLFLMKFKKDPRGAVDGIDDLLRGAEVNVGKPVEGKGGEAVALVPMPKTDAATKVGEAVTLVQTPNQESTVKEGEVEETGSSVLTPKADFQVEGPSTQTRAETNGRGEVTEKEDTAAGSADLTTVGKVAAIDSVTVARAADSAN
ncbi:P-loop containing nucleoside triphosphate hydrolase protein [Gonapodya prolifera JEL478]|uniref:p-loop containing nucleoside triphosphate hydrolase protein n=1 Tax=Gonapodya prolifera (strain JEL478) TaxID=1344416 RepID=A0A139AWG6_GONPJ|nr:P-loop containing nucleoside triphosphate hydrolase protein [Gonapodya prolifera JEL478]|eukprot:KXS20923.1 P-loop containing nucleoside triphosphate hydrolase protein [Gonapodya prolifera JEL478]